MFGRINKKSNIKAVCAISSLNPFHATGLFRHPLKISENQQFSDVFRLMPPNQSINQFNNPADIVSRLRLVIFQHLVLQNGQVKDFVLGDESLKIQATA